MSQTGFEDVVIEWLKKLDAGQDELKHEVVAHQSLTERTLQQATLTNGRVAKNHDRLLSLEDWRKHVDGVERDRKVRGDERRRWGHYILAALKSEIFRWCIVAIGVAWAWVQ